MTDQLNGVALVTGGSCGIGRAIAERLASAGTRVAIAGRTQRDVEEVAAAIDGIPMVLDVTDQAAVLKGVEHVERELGPIDLLVNNAGIIEPGGPAWERSPDEWWRALPRPWLTTRAATVCSCSPSGLARFARH